MNQARRFAIVWLFTARLAGAESLGAAFLADWLGKMLPIMPRGYVCPWTATAPTIDGKLDDAAWLAAPWTGDFTDIEGEAKPQPLHRTRAKMTWDDSCFYVAAEMEAPHVWANQTWHDSVIFEDPDFEVFIDPDGDSHEYCEFEINARNTGWDLLLVRPYKDGGPPRNDWEIRGLVTAVNVRGTLNDPSDTDEGWSVEIAIPWAALAGIAHRATPPAEGDQWRMGFSHVEWQVDVKDGKYVKKPNTPEYNWIWSPQGVVDMHRPERWGHVQFTKLSPAPALRPDPTRPVRDHLQTVYYAQKDHYAKHGRWAASLPELGPLPPKPNTVGKVEMKPDARGFTCSAELLLTDGGKQRWGIRDDGLVLPEDRWWPERAATALVTAGANAPEIARALKEVPAAHREAMEFLVDHMPAVDLRSLKADFLLEHVRDRCGVFAEAPWAKRVPREIFLNDVLAYASLNEVRDDSRVKVRELAAPLVKDCKTPGEAALALNRKLFAATKVRYSTERKKPDQSPLETLASGKASCSGLSILLVEACRAVGVPARVVGTPLWTNLRGNHTWIEVWDSDWHFLGAAEPDPKGLDHGWFAGDAAKADDSRMEHRIYASSFQRTGMAFPLPWDGRIQWVNAVNVTARYVPAAKPTGQPRLLVRVIDKATGQRVAAKVTLRAKSGEGTVLTGTSSDENVDLNRMVGFAVTPGREYRVDVEHHGVRVERTVSASGEAEQVVTLTVPE